MFNDNTYTFELRNISGFGLVDSIQVSVANGFPTNFPSIQAVAFDDVSNKFYATDTDTNAVWQINGSSLAFESSDVVPGYSYPMGIQVYNATPPVAFTKSFGNIMW